MAYFDTTRARLFSRRLGDHTVIALHGELDIATTAAIRDQMLRILGDTTTPVIIDLSGVVFCDASGLALLVGIQRRARLHGLLVSLVSPQPRVMRLLRITGLDRGFAVHPSLAAARPRQSRAASPTAA